MLNLGLNDQTVEALAKRSGDRRFAYDSYRRFVQMYSDVVLGIDLSHFEKLLDRAKQRRKAGMELDGTGWSWSKLFGLSAVPSVLFVKWKNPPYRRSMNDTNIDQVTKNMPTIVHQHLQQQLPKSAPNSTLP